MIPRTPEDWLTQVVLAQRYRAAFNREQRWRDNFEWYMGRYPKGLIPVNIVFGITRGTIPKIYFKAPTIIVRPRPSQGQVYAERLAQAKVLEAVDAMVIQQTGLKRTLKACLVDAFLFNIGVMKVGYHSLDTEFAEGEDTETADILATLDELGGGGEGAEGGETDDERRRRRMYSYHDLVKPDMPWVLRVSPSDFVVPVGTRCIEEAPWCAFRVTRRLEEVKASPVYRNTRSLMGNSSLVILGDHMDVSGGVQSPQLYRQVGVGSDTEYVTMWEIWDKRTGRVTVVADGHDKFLRNEEHGMPMDTLPVELIQFNPSGDDFWGISNIDAIAPQVMEYNETRTMEMAHRRISALRVIALESAFSPEEREKLKRGDVGPIIFTKELPAQAVTTFTPHMSRDIYKVAGDIFDDIRTIIGHNRNQGGEFEQSRRTAAEVKTVAHHNFIRDDEIRDIVADAIAALFQTKIHPLLFHNWDTRRVVQLTSSPAQGVPWVEYDPARIRGDYDVFVVPDSTVPMTKDQEKSETLQVFTLLRGDPMVRQLPLYTALLDKFDQFKPEELVKTPQELQQEQEAQMRIQMMMNQSQVQPVTPLKRKGEERAGTQRN